MARTSTGNRRVQPAEVKKARRRGVFRAVVLSAARLLAALTVVTLTFGGVIAGYLWLTSTPHLAVRDVRFAGNHRARLDQLADLARIRPGTNLWRIDGDEIEARLESHPWIRHAHVRKDWPAGLSIEVEEHVAKAIAVQGGLYLVDGEGTIFKNFDPGSDPRGLPVITGLDTEASAAELREPLRQALAVLAAWNEIEGRRPLAEIHRDPVRGTSLTLAESDAAPPLVAHLGRNELGARMKRLDHLLLLLSERGEAPREVFVEGHTRPQWVVARVE
ncbi:MAG: FtsQ-type POTRA domain-containing protein [Deltaproteobacteria bacterium]|nr:FtsQ-type POTRA domain-containing protein [Deltaproteobacteria bacterium]